MKAKAKAKPKPKRKPVSAKHKVSDDAKKAAKKKRRDLDAELEEFQKEFAIIRKPVAILVKEDLQLLPEKKFLLLTRNRRAEKNDDGSKTIIPVAPVWLSSRDRTTHTKIVYEPQSPIVTASNAFNRYRPPPFEPRKPTKKELAMFLRLVEFIFHMSREVILWFLGWCAYPHQHPEDAKLIHAVLVKGELKGTGKSLLGRLIGSSYGQNYGFVESQYLMGNFNDWQVDKQFIVGDEILGDDRRQGMDYLKNLITRKTVRINEKFQPPYEVDDLINYYLTSNHPDAIRLDDDERRFLVVGVEQTKPLPDDLDRWAVNWWKSGESGPALLYYFRNMVDGSKYENKGEAPRTDALQEMAEHGDTGIRRWCREMLANPDSHLRTEHNTDLVGSLLEPVELASCYVKSAGLMTADLLRISVAIGIALKSLKVPRFHLKKNKCGIDKRVYACRHLEFWRQVWNESTTDAERQRKAAEHVKDPRKPIFDVFEGGQKRGKNIPKNASNNSSNKRRRPRHRLRSGSGKARKPAPSTGATKRKQRKT